MRESLLVFVLVLGSPLAHVLVLRYDLLRPLKRPLDGGATFRGRRVFGDNKTWRGGLMMAGGVVVLTLLLSLWPTYWDALPEDLTEAGPLVVGTLVGLAVVVGELPNSFFKRQLGIAPGAQRRSPAGIALIVWDQADFVPFIVLFLAPVWLMPLGHASVAFAVVAFVHFAINVIGYVVGARTAPI
jgi:CDP-2,3-bis-(O-geranylgeranyl)-sn-glycerol synthase